jgi:ankyrin repeat protein
MSRAATAPSTPAPPRRLAPRARARPHVPRGGCKVYPHLPRAYHPDRHFTFDENHDTKFLSWLADLTVAVENSTWAAVPALLRFPRAKPHVVLQLAAGDGQLRLVETILRSCDDLDVRGVDAAGAAVAAASRGHPRTLAAILDAGLSPDAVDEHDTALLTAALRAADVAPLEASRACVSLLLDRGADADARASRRGWKPIMAAAKSGDAGAVRLLVRAGAEVNVRYPNGKTPLYCAAEWGRMEAARALLDAGADPRSSAERLLTDHAAGVKGVTPEEVAVRNGHEAVAAMLRTVAGAR